MYIFVSEKVGIIKQMTRFKVEILEINSLCSSPDVAILMTCDQGSGSFPSNNSGSSSIRSSNLDLDSSESGISLLYKWAPLHKL